MTKHTFIIVSHFIVSFFLYQVILGFDMLKNIYFFTNTLIPKPFFLLYIWASKMFFTHFNREYNQT